MTAVSVIIPSYNRAEKLLRAVSSVIYQTYKDYEIIIVDDGSTDDTNNRLAPFYPYIKYLAHSQNQGVSAARNTGIRAACAPLIALLDSDDYWLPEKLETQCRFFDQNPKAQICQTEEIWIRHGKRVNPRQKHLKPTGDIFQASLKQCMISPSAVMFRRSLLDEIGLFDETFPVCEDYDLWLRITARYPVALIPRFLLVKEGGAPDQLSSRFKGMDLFRIKSMIKLMQNSRLSEEQKDLCINELTNKCIIYGQGCVKRGKADEGNYYLQLPEMMKQAGF